MNLLRHFRSSSAIQPSHVPSQERSLHTKLAAGAVLVSLAASLAPFQPVRAAENISLEYGPIQRMLPYSELESFAQTGEPTGILADLIEIAKQDPDKMQKMLNSSLPIKVTTMDRLVNSYVGEVVLGQVGRIILPLGSTGDPVTPLKAALVGGVVDNQISVLSFVKSYPVDMKINGEEALAIKEQIEEDGKYLPEILTGLQGMLSRFIPGFSLSPADTTPAPEPAPQVTPAPEAAPAPEVVPMPEASPTPEAPPAPEAAPAPEAIPE